MADPVVGSAESAVLERGAIQLAERAADRDDAIRQCGAVLVATGAVEPAYVDAMLERERSISTYVGEGVAIPHATLAGKEAVRRDALAVLRFPDVVVVGAGPIGCLHVRLARARGAARVFLADVNADRLAAAAAIVAPDATVDSSHVDPVDEVLKLTDGRGADVVIVAAASGKAQEQGLQMAARQGRISFFGGLPKDNPVIACDSNLVHYRELTIVGANGSSPAHNRQALRLIASGAVPVADLITHRLPLDRALEAEGEGAEASLDALADLLVRDLDAEPAGA